MLYGLLADVHANLVALQAVVSELDRTGVDLVVVAGDLVGYGPFPNECVDLLRDREAVCVAGNHDLYATQRLIPRRVPPIVTASTAWTAARLRHDVRAYLAALPTMTELADIVVAHGSLADAEEYVTSSGQAGRHLAAVSARYPAARTVVLGHTHRQWLFGPESGDIKPHGDRRLPRPQELHLVNPGSVGQSRQREAEPLARFAVLDAGADVLSFRSLSYDVDLARFHLQRAGLPQSSVHLLPTGGGRSRARALLRRAVHTRLRR